MTQIWSFILPRRIISVLVKLWNSEIFYLFFWEIFHSSKVSSWTLTRPSVQLMRGYTQRNVFIFWKICVASMVVPHYCSNHFWCLPHKRFMKITNIICLSKPYYDWIHGLLGTIVIILRQTYYICNFRVTFVANQIWFPQRFVVKFLHS